MSATSASTRPITTLLSQYELLISLCKNLSSADIIHVAATSTEHWQYVASSPRLLKALIQDSSCDGTGIVAQARVFGYWNASPERATGKCRGRAAQPCRDCGAMVCNVILALLLHFCLTATNNVQMCRFHVEYPKYGPYAHDVTGSPEEYLDDEEQEMWDEQWESDEKDLSDCIEEGDTSIGRIFAAVWRPSRPRPCSHPCLACHSASTANHSSSRSTILTKARCVTVTAYTVTSAKNGAAYHAYW
jgi:hypothetical protein